MQQQLLLSGQWRRKEVGGHLRLPESSIPTPPLVPGREPGSDPGWPRCTAAGRSSTPPNSRPRCAAVGEEVTQSADRSADFYHSNLI